MVLFGLYFIERYGNTLTFSPGGVISKAAAAEHEGILLVLAMVMLIGFSVKAGMFPMHAWLPTDTSRSHAAEEASEGIRQSPRGERHTLPTLGPSGIHERLNC